jgi:hypothetical protein
MNTKLILAGGVLAATLFSGSIAFADSDRKKECENRFGIKLGAFFKDHDRGDNHWGKSLEKRMDNSVTIRGDVTALNGTVLSLRTDGGATYTVNTSGAEFKHTTLADIAVGDSIMVRGELDGTILTAETVKEKKGDTDSKAHARVTGGSVTAVTGTEITVDRFGPKGTTTVATDASTRYLLDGATTTRAALAAGVHVIILGTTSTTTGVFTASIVHIISETWGFLAHAFNR